MNKEILIRRDGKQLGPYTLSEINAHLAAGQISANDMARHEGASDWQPIRTIDGVDFDRRTKPSRTNPAFQHPTYLVRREVFKLFGGAFHIYDPQGNVAFYSEQKAFKLKEDIRAYSCEDQSRELLVIKARNIFDFEATYDVMDPNSGNAHVGSVKRSGFTSLIVDEWQFMDPSGREIGLIEEDSVLSALLRRFLVGWMLPQEYNGSIGSSAVCCFKRNFNPFVSTITLDFTADSQGLLDRRLGIAAAVLLVAIEGKEDGLLDG